MSQPLPWIPAPNPGGQYRRALRWALQTWLVAQQIPGISEIYRNPQLVERFDFSQSGSSRFACVVGIEVTHDVEVRQATSGPDNPGGKDLRADFALMIRHQAYNLESDDDWNDAQDDLDRIVDSIRDSLHGPGRCLGRPDLYTSVGEYPREGSITVDMLEPVADFKSGNRTQWATVRATAVQYLETAPAWIGP